MTNPFPYSSDNKRYHTLNYYWHEKFGLKVFKVNLNAGFSCPNRDGTKGYGGCTFCSDLGSGDLAGNKNDDLITQFNKIKQRLHKKWPHSKYIGYFQANSNTYAPVDVLKQKYEPILKLDNVVGLTIATRPDTITKEVLDYLEDLNKRTYLTIELGLQTIHERTANLVNRCYPLSCFIEAVKQLRKRHIEVVVHIINGLPYETKEMMLETIKFLATRDIQGLKIHMLYLINGTKLATFYKKNTLPILSKEEYIDIVCEQLALLPPKMVIHRLTSDPVEETLIEPKWLLKKFIVLNDIDKKLHQSDIYQGFNLNILNRFRQILRSNLQKKDLVIDATVGNGNDTLFLCNIVTEGHVYGFDIQDTAINNTTNLLLKHKKNNYTLFKESHSNMIKVLPTLKDKVSAVVFNLGYLPGGHKKITTNYQTTIKAIRNSLWFLNNKGICLIVVYPGHKEGQREAIGIDKYLLKIKNDYQVKYYYNTVNNKAPYLISIKKPVNK